MDNKCKKLEISIESISQYFWSSKLCVQSSMLSAMGNIKLRQPSALSLGDDIKQSYNAK